MSDSYGKREPEQNDSAQLEKLLEIELMQKRAAWKQAKQRSSSLRNLSYLFLLLVVLGALVAYFLLVANR